ncbi:MAG: replication initiator protein [Microviridae sp.]|nr:MAG: replication initiator protein [Microviridae sp.]
MPCYHPMPAVRMSDGSVKFVSRNKRGVESTLELPCGQCIGCRLERSRQWAVRCLHEASLHERNAFITLTYDESSVPLGGSLKYRDFQLFMKRLRKLVGKVSFYCGGEYGEQVMRPHYHACIFGYDFPDKVYFKKSSDGSKLYTSKLLEKLWPHGMSSTGDVTFASAAYIARYCVQKVTGDRAAAHYRVITDDGEIIDRVPEFNRMSLNPAVGKRWLEKFQTDVYPRDYVVVNGVKCKPPSYYDTLFEKENPGVFSELVAQRELDTINLQRAYPGEFSRNEYKYYFLGIVDRMSVKEQVHLARSNMLKRSL